MTGGGVYIIAICIGVDPVGGNQHHGGGNSALQKITVGDPAYSIADFALFITMVHQINGGGSAGDRFDGLRRELRGGNEEAGSGGEKIVGKGKNDGRAVDRQAVHLRRCGDGAVLAGGAETLIAVVGGAVGLHEFPARPVLQGGRIDLQREGTVGAEGGCARAGGVNVCAAAGIPTDGAAAQQRGGESLFGFGVPAVIIGVQRRFPLQKLRVHGNIAAGQQRDGLGDQVLLGLVLSVLKGNDQKQQTDVQQHQDQNGDIFQSVGFHGANRSFQTGSGLY